MICVEAEKVSGRRKQTIKETNTFKAVVVAVVVVVVVSDSFQVRFTESYVETVRMLVSKVDKTCKVIDKLVAGERAKTSMIPRVLINVNILVKEAEELKATGLSAFGIKVESGASARKKRKTGDA